MHKYISASEHPYIITFQKRVCDMSICIADFNSIVMHTAKYWTTSTWILFVPQFAILIHSFITSRIDFFNSVYFTLPDYSRSQIQTIQNSCVRCLTGARRFDSAKEALKTLHWLPVKARAQFKILLFAYQIFYHVPNTPRYFQDQFYI